jgi:hypothetical protein
MPTIVAPAVNSKIPDRMPIKLYVLLEDKMVINPENPYT